MTNNNGKEVYETSTQIPVWKRYLLNVYEAADYYHIGEKKIRAMAQQYPDVEFALYVGTKILIKRRRFEEFLDSASTI